MNTYRILGGLALVRDGESIDLGGEKRRTVLASLLVDLGHAVSPDVLIDHVWGDGPPKSAETSLQAYISTLRRALEPERRAREAANVLVTRAAGYALIAARSSLDATTFEDLAAAGHDALRRGEAVAAASTLEEALAMWAGPPLPELAGAHWVDAFAARLVEMRAQALEDRFEAGLALGDHAALVSRIEAAIVEEPFRERLRAQLALALFRSGRQRDAIQSLQTARAVLLDEAGIDPGPELRQLESDILSQSAVLAPPVPAPMAAAQVEETSGADTVQPAAVAPRPFVGRGRELQALVEAAGAASGGAGRPIVISGEPGIGKTRLVEELTARVPGMVLAWARCPESAGQAAYWPCIQIAQQLEAETERDDVTALLNRDLPEGSDPFAHHLAVAQALARAGRPFVLVVDDLQWADPASLRVIELMAGELRSVPTLFVATTRPSAGDAPPALLGCMAELARQPGALRLDLAGLTERDVETWLHDRAAPGVAEVVHSRTAGNPFFVQEVIELLESEGRLGDRDSVAQSRRVPAAVQDVIRRRVGRLPVDAQQLLTTASAIGRWFDLDLLAAVARVATIDALELLDPSLRAGIVDETDLPSRFAFSHALVADTLAAELSAARRARLHVAIADALVRLRAADLDGHVSEIAHHAFEGAAAGSAEQALEWTIRSGRAARSRLAFEDAVQEYVRALHALSLARPEDLSTRFEILCELALAHLGNDSVEGSFPVIEQAIDLAIERGDVEGLGRAAALANVEGLWFAGEIGMTTVDMVSALRRALDAFPAEPSATRALILGGLAEVAYWRLPPAELERISAEAVSNARASGDRRVLVRSLLKRIQALWRASSLADRLEAAEELKAVAQEGLSPADEAYALYAVAATEREACDVAAADRLVARARDLAHQAGSVALITQLDLFQATLHTWYGRLDAADRLIDEWYEVYRRTRGWNATVFRSAFKGLVAMERGDLAALDGYWVALDDSPYATAFVEMYAFCLCELGAVDRAAALIGNARPQLVDSWLYLGILGTAAHVRVTVGDEHGAAALLDQLRTHERSLAVMGSGPSFGDIGFALARVEHMLGNAEEARRVIDGSIARIEPSGPSPWLARSLLFRSQVIGSEQDKRAARQIVDDLNLGALRSRM